MTRPTVSVVFATYNRAHLLERTILGYNRIDFDLDHLELVVVDDDSDDRTEEVVRSIDSRVNLVYIKLRKPFGLWRDVASVINVGLRACQGKVIVATHPEVIPGIQTIKSMVEHVKMNHYVCAVPWYLSPRDQERIDTVNWLGKGNYAVREIDGFYDERPGGHPDYHPAAIDKVGHEGGHPHWLSWVMGAMTRETWSHLGGFIETTAWGAVDLLFLQRRQKLGIQNITLNGDQERVIHQNHDVPVGHFKPTERDMDECHRQAPNLSPEQCRWPHVDHLWGPY